MDITTALGLFAGAVVLCTMILMGGDLGMFVSDHAIIVIFGGSFSATLIRFPLTTILHGLPMGAKFAFTMRRWTARQLVDEIARLAVVARKQGPIGLEKEEIEDPFLAQGMRFVADGYDATFIRDNLERDRDNFLTHPIRCRAGSALSRRRLRNFVFFRFSVAMLFRQISQQHFTNQRWALGVADHQHAVDDQRPVDVFVQLLAVQFVGDRQADQVGGASRRRMSQAARSPCRGQAWRDRSCSKRRRPRQAPTRRVATAISARASTMTRTSAPCRSACRPCRRPGRSAFALASASLRQAMQDMPEIAEISKHVMIEESKQGLNIELMDQNGSSMFPEASKVPYERTRRLVQRLSVPLKALPYRISISGHTAASKQSASPAYGPWELSADRANSIRKILEEEGVPTANFYMVAGRADTQPLFPDDPFVAANRRVTITLMREAPPIPVKLNP